MAQPEKLNIWDRFFNRYRKEIVQEGYQIFCRTYDYYRTGLLAGSKIPNSEYRAYVVRYKITDRLTGSETLKEEVL